MISTDKKIEVMSQYKEGANILLKRPSKSPSKKPITRATIIVSITVFINFPLIKTR